MIPYSCSVEGFKLFKLWFSVWKSELRFNLKWAFDYRVQGEFLQGFGTVSSLLNEWGSLIYRGGTRLVRNMSWRIIANHSVRKRIFLIFGVVLAWGRYVRIRWWKNLSRRVVPSVESFVESLLRKNIYMLWWKFDFLLLCNILLWLMYGLKHSLIQNIFGVLLVFKTYPFHAFHVPSSSWLCDLEIS